MKRRLILICAVMFFVALAIPAFAAVQNVKVSGDIAATYVGRNNFDLGRKDDGVTGGRDNSNVVMSQIRLRVDADLTDNVSTTIRLLNERDWGAEDDRINNTVAGGTSTAVTRNTNSTEVDLDLAYVTLKEMLYSPLTVTIGRQLLRFGNAMVIGDPDTSRQETSKNPNIVNRDLSLRKSFDAIRANLNYDPLSIDLFYSLLKHNYTITTPAHNDRDDVNLYGINANYKIGDKYDSMVEAYLFEKRDDSKIGDQNKGPDVVRTPGLRIVTNPIKGLNLQVEQAWQFGTKNVSAAYNRHREAMATQFIANYALPFESLAKYSPVVGVQWSRFSGDKNPASTTDNYTAWDPMYIDQGVGTINNVLFDKTNSRVFNINMAANLIEDLNLKFDYTSIWLDRKLNTDRWGNQNANLFTLYQTGGSYFYPSMQEGKKHLGNEYDLTLTYDYTEDVQFKLLGGIFTKGNAFVKKTMNFQSKNPATQLMASCKVTF
jgi:hypothetical protein